MRYAPPLRNIKAKHLSKLCCSLTCDGISPCPKWHKQIILLVKRQIAVHHAGNTHCADRSQFDIIFFFYIIGKRSVAFAHTRPNIVEMICPDAVFELIFRAMSCRRVSTLLFFQFSYSTPSCLFKQQNFITLNKKIKEKKQN